MPVSPEPGIRVYTNETPKLASVTSVSAPFRQAQGPELVEGLCALCVASPILVYLADRFGIDLRGLLCGSAPLR